MKKGVIPSLLGTAVTVNVCFRYPFPCNIPSLLGTAVTGATLYMNGQDIMKRSKRRSNVETMIATGLLGFGLAHVLLGGIDMFKKGE